MFDCGKEFDWFNLIEVVVLMVVVIVGFVFFLVWELIEDYFVVDLMLFKGCNFSVGVVVILVVYGLFFGNFVILLLWL